MYFMPVMWMYGTDPIWHKLPNVLCLTQCAHLMLLCTLLDPMCWPLATMYWPNVLFLMLFIFPDSFDPMFLSIWTQCVLTHSVLTHCVRTQCGAQKCLAYKKKLAKSTFAICSLCCKVLQLYGSLCSLWGGRKSLLFWFLPIFAHSLYAVFLFIWHV